MANFKCKMCGGDLQLIEGETVCECEYCGSKQTVPFADNDKKMNLFQRANRLRFNNEFDKAAGIYESIIAEFPEEAEAYWGLILCKYGIEYVDDPATGKKIPTCHRSAFDSVLDDQDFEMVMEYADPISKRVYREEAKKIEELRKGIIAVSSKEEPYDIFICYKETDENGDRTLDSVLAQDIYNALTDEGYRVFFSRISLEDKLGQEYEPYIFAALHSAKVMLAVGTQYEYYDSVWVKNEWSRFLQLIASGEKKTLIPVYKNLDAYDMPKEFARLQAQDMGKIGATQDLLRGINKILGTTASVRIMKPASETYPGAALLSVQNDALLKRGYMSLEDRDFTKADDFFEQVLNIDPECGKAYWGKVLTEFRVSDNAELAKYLFRKLREQAKTERIVIPIDVIKAARTAAGDTGILDDFQDEELQRYLKKYLCEPFSFESIKLYLSNLIQRYENAESLKSLIENRNYERTLQYADPEVESNIGIVLSDLKDEINYEIRKDEADFDAVKSQADKAFDELTEKINRCLSKAIASYNEKKNAAAIEEEKAYQDALEVYEQSYKDQLESWKSRKESYDRNYQSAVTKQSSLKASISRLEEEKANLRGLFTGRRREELESNIALLKRQLNDLYFPKDPGAMPVKGPVPKKEDFIKQISADNFDIRKTVRVALDPDYVELVSVSGNIKKGDNYIQFGRYPYSDKMHIEPLVWRVLTVNQNKALIITRDGIDARKYNDKYSSVTWETSALRKWLNNEFLNAAFLKEEKNLILTSSVSPGINPAYDTDPGIITQDKIFFLSIQEVKRYFKDAKSRQASLTPYAKKKGAYESGSYGCWWLRSPGSYSRNAAFVDSSGSIPLSGTTVYDDSNAVRPALWIDISDKNH